MKESVTEGEHAVIELVNGERFAAREWRYGVTAWNAPAADTIEATGCYEQLEGALIDAVFPLTSVVAVNLEAVSLEAAK